MLDTVLSILREKTLRREATRSPFAPAVNRGRRTFFMRGNRVPRAAAFLCAILLCRHQAAAAEDDAPVLAAFALGSPTIIKAEWESDRLEDADLNNDGLTDFATVNNNRNLLEIYYQKREEGKSSFEKKEQVLDQSVTGMATGDFNGDGRKDLILAPSDKDVVVRYQQDDGTLGPAEPLEARGLFVSAGDLDGDGREDLAVLAREKVVLLYGENREPLGKAKPVTFFNGSEPAGPLLVGDFDGNGLDDLAYQDSKRRSRLLVRFQRNARRWSMESAFEIADAAQLAVLRPNEESRRVSLAIVDSKTRELRLYRLREAKKTSVEMPLSTPFFLSFDPRSRIGDETLIAADLNGDGRMDLIAASPKGAEMSLYAQTAEGDLEVKTAPSLSDIKAVVVVPRKEGALLFSLSGREETIGVAVWDPARGLTVPDLLDFDRKPLALAAGDLNASGRDDLVFLYKDEEDKPKLGVFADPTTPGLFREKPQTRDLPPETGADPVGMMMADLNGDGRCDLLVFSQYDPLRLLLQDENGGFTPFATDQGMKKGIFNKVLPGNLAVSDLDGDGAKEMLIASENFVRAYRIDETGDLRLVEQFNGKNVSSRIASVAVADLDGSKTPEVVLLDAGTQSLTIYGRADSGDWALIRHHDIEGVEGKRLLAADANHDGRDDLLIYEGGNMQLLYSGSPAEKLESAWRRAPDEKEGKYARADAVRLLAGEQGRGDQLAVIEGTDNVLELFRFDENAADALERFSYFKIFDDESSISRDRDLRGRQDPRDLLSTDVDGDGQEDLVVLMHDNIVYYRQIQPPPPEQKAPSKTDEPDETRGPD
ncbi:MAG TPA: VCBS repeat-containing protein [Sumerlaeia bacterium]|nr:VCBS repeat-containing protein [Sumerlaeia bacterium]